MTVAAYCATSLSGDVAGNKPGGSGGAGGNSGGSNPSCTTCGVPPRGWVAVDDVNDPISPVMDSIPGILSRVADTQMDSMYLKGLESNFREHGFVVVRKNGMVYTKNLKIGLQSTVDINYTLASGEELLAYGHIHSEDTVNFYRTSFSVEDLIEFNKNATKLGFTAILEVGNARYAFVVEDLAKKTAFNVAKRGHKKSFYQLLNSLSSQYSNGQLLTEETWIQYLGSVSLSGIGFYKSTAPDKNNFIKLNP